MAEKAIARKKRSRGQGKVVSVRFTDAALHIKGRQYAVGQGITFGELVSAALAEYLKKRGV
jgi:hypothetical protein